MNERCICWGLHEAHEVVNVHFKQFGEVFRIHVIGVWQWEMCWEAHVFKFVGGQGVFVVEIFLADVTGRLSGGAEYRW